MQHADRVHSPLVKVQAQPLSCLFPVVLPTFSGSSAFSCLEFITSPGTQCFPWKSVIKSQTNVPSVLSSAALSNKRGEQGMVTSHRSPLPVPLQQQGLEPKPTALSQASLPSLPSFSPAHSQGGGISVPPTLPCLGAVPVPGNSLVFIFALLHLHSHLCNCSRLGWEPTCSLASW